MYAFGALECDPDWYYFADIDLRGSGLSHTMHEDGALGGVLASAYDDQTGELTLGTCGQFMLWSATGCRHRLAGDHGDIQYDDDNPVDFHHSTEECYSYSCGIAPCPLHMMVGFASCRENPCAPHGCSGRERLTASARARRCGCRVKAVVHRGTPGETYVVLMPTSSCVEATADGRGRAAARECPGRSGEVSLPSCDDRVNVACP